MSCRGFASFPPVPALLFALVAAPAAQQPRIAIDVNTVTSEVDTTDTVSEPHVFAHVLLLEAQAVTKYEITVRYTRTILGVSSVHDDDTARAMPNILKAAMADGIDWTWSSDLFAETITIRGEITAASGQTHADGDGLAAVVQFFFKEAGLAFVTPLAAAVTDTAGVVDTVEALIRGAVRRQSTAAVAPAWTIVPRSRTGTRPVLPNGRAAPSRVPSTIFLFGPEPAKVLRLGGPGRG